jgi:pimeloyl-ACP methyl ester carboxylesterase
MRLHYETIGAGQPLVILHGLFGSLDNWRTMSKKLSDRYQVFSVDLRNHGGSPHSAEFSYPLMADDLKEFMHQHLLCSACLLGHSMGGKVAMQFALTHPQLVDKLIVVDIAPRAYPPKHKDIFEVLFALHLERFSGRNEVRRELQKEISDRSISEFILKNIIVSQPGKLQWKMNLVSLHENYHEIIAAPYGEGGFTKPTLFVLGGDSDYIEPEDDGVIRKYFPCAELATVPGVSHWVHAQAPGIFEEKVRDFLSRSEDR